LERKHVGLTMPRRVKGSMMEAAGALEWSAGDWVLAAAAEQTPVLRAGLTGMSVRKRPAIEDAAFTALYLTPDEREELDESAVACGLNRSAFVTAVSRLALGEAIDDVVRPIRAVDPPAVPDPSETSGAARRA